MELNNLSHKPLDPILIDIFKKFHVFFQDLTGVSCCLRYLDGSLAIQLEELPCHEIEFCRVIRESHEGRRACQKTDNYLCKLASKKEKAVSIQCHAGLYDFVVPVSVDRQIVTLINGGQLLPEPKSDKAYRRIRSKINKRIPVNDRKLRKAYFEKECISLDKLQSIIGLIGFVAESISQIHNSLRLAELTAKNSEITKAQHYIHDNIHRTITRDEVSGHVGMSPNHFSRMFSKTLGISFVEFVTKLRIENAKKLLLKTQFTISQISYQVGFQSAEYFHEVFRKYEKCSPGKYRFINTYLNAGVSYSPKKILLHQRASRKEPTTQQKDKFLEANRFIVT